MKNYLKVAIILFCILLNIAFNFTHAQPLYQLGLNWIYSMQQLSNPYLNVFFSFFTLIADPVIVTVGVCLFIVILKRKEQAYNTVLFILFNTFLMTIFKAFYVAPRPSWSHPSIKNIGYYCPRQYGNPSGHSWLTAIIATNLLLEFTQRKHKYTILTIAIALVIFVPLSRMYLGAHSLNQIIQGLFLGFSLVFLYSHGGLKQKINDLLNRSKKYQNALFFSLIALMHISYFAAYQFNHALTLQDKQISKIWAQNLKEKCGREIHQNTLNYTMLMLNSVVVNTITGLALGFQTMTFSHEGRSYLKGKWVFNLQKYSRPWIVYLAFIGIQFAHFVSGFVLASPILFILGNTNLSKFLYLNISCLITGLFYSSRSFKVLFGLKIIKPIENSDLQPKKE